MLKGLDHITINVTDLEKSIMFYGKILGLKQLNQVDLGDHSLYYFEIQGNCKLELIKYHFDTNLLLTKETDKGIYRHIAFIVDNINEMKKLCDKNNIKIKSEPSFIEKLKFKGMLVEDPNGVEIEFVEKV